MGLAGLKLAFLFKFRQVVPDVKGGFWRLKSSEDSVSVNCRELYHGPYDGIRK